MSSQQGPVNPPWYRFAFLMQPPPPPTTPATTPQPEPVPVPRPPFIRPTFKALAPASYQEPTRPPPPPQPSVAPPQPTVASAPTPLPVPSGAPTAPSPQIVAASQSPRTVAAVPSPTVVTPAPAMPSSKVVTSVPTMPSPRIAAAASPPTLTSSPQIVAAQPPSSPAEPQVLPTNGSSNTNSTIEKESFPSFPSPKQKISRLSSPSPPPEIVLPSPPPSSPSIVSLSSSNGPTATIPRNTTPISSPKIVKQQGKTPPPSPSMKSFAHPPSPLRLPPAQIKSDTMRQSRSPPVIEQKTVLVQETREKQKASPKNFKGGQSYSPKHDITKENGNHKKYSESEDFGMRIITLAGENKGAIMELSTSRRTNELGHVKSGSPRSWSNNEKSGSINGNIAKDLNEKAIPLPITVFTNSNVQDVNNSIVFNCSFAHHDPGIHLSLSKKPYGSKGIHIKDRSSSSHN